MTPAELSGLPNGLYKWQVRDYGGYGYGLLTALQEFTLNIPPAISVLGDPINTLTSWDQSFNWTGVSGATWYYLEVQNASGGILLGKWYTAGSICVAQSCTVTPAELSGLPNGLYKWQMRDYGGYGYGHLTALQEFTLNR